MNIQIGLEDIALISNLYRDLIDFKSRFTATHTTGVSECAVMLAEYFGFAEVDVKSMRIAGNFHDIGKLKIPNSILEKPASLTVDEFAIMRCHTYYTLYSIGGLQRIAEWAAYHHEKLDGSGYPFHCTNKEIGTGSRIMTVQIYLLHYLKIDLIEKVWIEMKFINISKDRQTKICWIDGLLNYYLTIMKKSADK